MGANFIGKICLQPSSAARTTKLRVSVASVKKGKCTKFQSSTSISSHLNKEYFPKKCHVIGAILDFQASSSYDSAFFTARTKMAIGIFVHWLCVYKLLYFTSPIAFIPNLKDVTSDKAYCNRSLLGHLDYRTSFFLQFSHCYCTESHRYFFLLDRLSL